MSVKDICLNYTKEFFAAESLLNHMEFTLARQLGEERRSIASSLENTKKKNYGYSVNNPICLSTNQSIKNYLNSLRLKENNSSIRYELVHTSITQCSQKNILLKVYAYMITTTEKKKYTIYFCPYGHDAQKTPEHFKLENFIEENPEKEISEDIVEAAIALKKVTREYLSHFSRCVACNCMIPPDTELCPGCGKKLNDTAKKNEIYQIKKRSDVINDSVKRNLQNKEGKKTNEIITPLFCRRCGADLIDGAKFCHKCGTKIVLLEEKQ